MGASVTVGMEALKDPIVERHTEGWPTRGGQSDAEKERLAHWGFYDLSSAYQFMYINC